MCEYWEEMLCPLPTMDFPSAPPDQLLLILWNLPEGPSDKPLPTPGTELVTPSSMFSWCWVFPFAALITSYYGGFFLFCLGGPAALGHRSCVPLLSVLAQRYWHSANTAGLQRMFPYHVDEMLWELHSGLSQLVCGKTVSLYTISLKSIEPIDGIK